MYAAHQGATAVRTVASGPSVSWKDGQGRDHSLWGLNGSASVKGDAITLTVTNSHLTEPRDTEIAVRGRVVRSVAATTLAARDVHDHNTFEAPRTVAPATANVPASAAPFVYRFPAASVTKLEITVGA
jgi:alpha-L-arabinofuranosidase